MKDAATVSINLPLQDLPIGVYFIQVDIADFRKTQKIVKIIK